MQLDLVVTPVDAPWPAYLDLARAADDAGFTTLWCLDHLSGATFDAGTIGECFTVLAGLAACTERIGLGPLVANVTLRLPALVANSAATLQLVSGGRLALGLGAGAGPDSRFGRELTAAGVARTSRTERHARLADTLDALDALWAPEGVRAPHLAGFPRPEPRPTVILGVHSLALARLAGARADGVNAWSTHPRLAEVFAQTRLAAQRAGRPEPLCSVWASYDEVWLDPSSPERRRARALGVHRIMLGVRPGAVTQARLAGVRVGISDRR